MYINVCVYVYMYMYFVHAALMRRRSKLDVDTCVVCACVYPHKYQTQVFGVCACMRGQVRWFTTSLTRSCRSRTKRSGSESGWTYSRLRLPPHLHKCLCLRRVDLFRRRPVLTRTLVRHMLAMHTHLLMRITLLHTRSHRRRSRRVPVVMTARGPAHDSRAEQGRGGLEGEGRRGARAAG
jgi:hypothetical protein